MIQLHLIHQVLSEGHQDTAIHSYLSSKYITYDSLVSLIAGRQLSTTLFGSTLFTWTVHSGFIELLP